MSATEYRHPGLSLEERAEAYLDSPIGAPVTRGLVIDLMAELTEARSRGVAEELSDALELDPEPWLFISDQVFGVFRSAVDQGFHSVSGTWWAFSPRPEYEQDRARYDAEKTTVHENRGHS